jgi:hypothetical protein
MIETLRTRYLYDSTVERALLVKRRSSLWLKTGIVFVHVPKAAGTSISEALYGRFTGHVRAADVLRWGSSRVRTLPRVAVARNPWDRLVSAYRFIKRGSGIGGPHAGRVLRPEQYRIPEFDSFESFVNDWLAGRDVMTLDLALQPQSQFLFNHRGEILVDHLGRFEALAPTYAYLDGHIGGLAPMGRSNRSGDPVDYRTFYTPEVVERVGQIYAEDIRMLGYRYDGPATANHYTAYKARVGRQI